VIRSWHLGSHEQIVYSVVAAKGRARYESLWHGGYASRDDDPRNITQFYDGTVFNMFDHYQRRYEITTRFAVQPYISKVQMHFLYESLGWWPPGDVSEAPRPRGDPVFLVDVFNDERLCVGEGPTKLNGRRAVVVQIPQVVRLWVDERWGIVRQREDFAAGRDGRPVIVASHGLHDFHRYDGDIWLPRKITRDFPLHKQSTVHIIESYEVNSIGDDTFTFEPPPGTLVYDRDSDTYRQVPGGLDGLERVAQRMVEQTGRTHAREAVHPRSVAVLAVLGGGLIGYFLPRIALRTLKRFARKRMTDNLTVGV